jgi:hypothetical protein
MVHFTAIESLGLLNCWYIRDEALAYLVHHLKRMRTLNIFSSRAIGRMPVQLLIDSCATRRQLLKLYLHRSGARAEQLTCNGGVLFSAPPSRKRSLDPSPLAEDASRADWEYDSDSDFM